MFSTFFVFLLIHVSTQTSAYDLESSLVLRVTKVVRRYNEIKVTVEDGTTFVADAAIVSVPLGVLKANTIKFEPKLPDWKESAISDLGVGVENKIILQFEQVFWPNVEFLGVVAETTYECSYFLNLHKATGHSILVYMPAGQLAEDIEKLSDEAAANFAFTQLKKILPDASEPVRFLLSNISFATGHRIMHTNKDLELKTHHYFKICRSISLFPDGEQILTHLDHTVMT